MSFDYIVVTAANAAQARGYRAFLAGRKNVFVISDPGGKRVGSLGATVNLLKKLKLSGRVLICHSGGDARRTPSYAAMGKAFIPMRDKRALFDHIVEAMEKLPMRDGFLVVSGDVLPTFDFSRADFSRDGVTGVAYLDGPAEAQRHGVYFEENSRVIDFKQKPNVKRGSFLIDTGVMFIDSDTAEKMKSLPISGDIYDEFPKMLLNGFAPFWVNVMPKCNFYHIGSSRELLNRLGDGKTYLDCVGCEKLELQGENIITNVPPGRFKKIKLAKGECLTCLPIGKNDWYDLYYKITDNFKTDGLWEKHGLADKMRKINHARLLALRQKKEIIRVSAPVRIDFAGGWSDTPPICNKEGGVVVNAAVLIEGKRPIEVVVKPRKDKIIRVISKDLKKTTTLATKEEVLDHKNPFDWCALAKAALTVVKFPVGERGIDLIMTAKLPKGSGLGTSSILGAATIAALLGSTKEADKIADLTLQLEQEMCTGGGWQDQFGGIFGGVKKLVSRPGKKQIVSVSKLSSNAFSKLIATRGLLYFTGQKRLARNILRKVLSFYAENPHGFASILIDSLKTDAEAIAQAIMSGDANRFARAVNGYWRDKKLLDPGSTNERVEEIISLVKPYIDAVTLTGAGGGGFMFMLAKSPSAAKKIREVLAKNPPSDVSRFYDFTLDDQGMVLTRE